MFENELYHYGVVGMKWGIRRGRVSAHTENIVGRSYTTKQKKKMTKNAVKILNRRMEGRNRMADSYERAAARSKTDVSRMSNELAARQHRAVAKLYETKIGEIDSGKIKAGRDFVTNSTYSSNLLLDAVGVLNLRTARRVDFK